MFSKKEKLYKAIVTYYDSLGNSTTKIHDYWNEAQVNNFITEINRIVNLDSVLNCRAVIKVEEM